MKIGYKSSVKLGRILINLLIMLGIYSNVHSQDYVYDNTVYLDYIKTVKLSHAGRELTYPVVDLRSKYQERLLLSFDDLEGGYKRYTYHLVHCDMDWNPTEDFDEIEYLDGFNGQDIEDYSYSTNGYSEYTHYRLLLPNDDIKWIVSGNYLLIIYDDELEIPVLTRRIIVVEDRVNLAYEIIKPRNVRKINTHQEMKLIVNYKNFRINQPKIELFATILQNGNWNNSIQGIKGNYERGQALIFDQFDNISFPALKEFRNFDIRPLSYTTEFVNSIEQNDIETSVLLDLNKKRNNRNFLGEIDANGFFIVDNERYNDPEVSSEYCKVLFTLQSKYKYEKDLFMIGGFSDWQAKDEFKLEYDPIQELYWGEAYFKQGYYDYLFALLNEDGSLDFESLEGSWYETENDYQVLIYYKEFGSYYDRILVAKTFNSNK